MAGTCCYGKGFLLDLFYKITLNQLGRIHDLTGMVLISVPGLNNITQLCSLNMAQPLTESVRKIVCMLCVIRKMSEKVLSENINHSSTKNLGIVPFCKSVLKNCWRFFFFSEPPSYPATDICGNCSFGNFCVTLQRIQPPKKEHISVAAVIKTAHNHKINLAICFLVAQKQTE